MIGECESEAAVLTAVVDGVRDHGVQPAGEPPVTVGEEGGEHEAHHAEVHVLRLVGRSAADQTALVLWGGNGGGTASAGAGSILLGQY